MTNIINTIHVHVCPDAYVCILRLRVTSHNFHNLILFFKLELSSYCWQHIFDMLFILEIWKILLNIDIICYAL